ncbi:TRAP transporter small permease [Roseibium aggregatum]|uniref:TRAP transporter small permease n=1 Tax=Roseibium aggregatum TaxID=187304 RepID=UPI001AD8C06B|nr:TRAP transporter small permease subunit [Roseibium aggregatum]
MPVLKKLADRLIGLSAIFGSIGLIIEVVVILVDVTGRYFGAPLTGAQDISQMTMVIVVFGGMALCDKLGGHISVDVFEHVFPPRLLWFGDVIGPLLGAVIFCGIAWTVWESAALSRMLNLATNIIYLPKAWFQYVMVVLSLITAFGMVLRALEIAWSGVPLSHKPDEAI